MNGGTGKLAYSDFPVFFDADSAYAFQHSLKKVTMFLYDLATQAKQTLADSAAKAFEPKWLDDKTVE